MRRRALLLAALLAACARAQPAARPAWSDPSQHTTTLVTVAPGVSLETLDWGGTGPTLVLLAGLGNTAHVYDEFAPQLTDSFRVIGITRRGFGASSKPPGDVAMMLADLRAALDSLHLGRVILAGHSLAGDELTPWATAAGEQCAALVYLDAAQDRSAVMALFQSNPYPAPAPPTAADSASPDAMRDYVDREFGPRVPLAEIHNTFVFDSAGKLVRDVTPDSVAWLAVAALPRPDYRRITCPALAIYAERDSAPDMFTNWATLDSAGRAMAKAAFPAWQAFMKTSRDQFVREMRGGRVLGLPRADHYVFISHQAEVLRAIRSMRAVADSAAPRRS